MLSDAEPEMMGLILTTNAELVSGVLRGTSAGQGDSVLAAVAATRNLDLIVADILHALVRKARGEGHTWAEIGEVLHVTRQAAFWARPRAYLDPAVRAATSPWRDLSPAVVDRALARLQTDLDSGAWERRYGELRRRAELDVGLRLVTANP